MKSEEKKKVEALQEDAARSKVKVSIHVAINGTWLCFTTTNHLIRYNPSLILFNTI